MVKKKARIEYGKESLAEEDVPKNPFLMFHHWWQEALDQEVPEVDAAHLATVDENHHANGRIVLLKSFDEQGMVFYTNYQSPKAQELENNPHAALTIFWPSLERQIRLRGETTRTSREESVAYFKTRPEGAQIGAWASPQSIKINNRDELEHHFTRIAIQYQDQVIPCPPHWGGFRLAPTYFEFWQGRQNRLHDRIAFTLTPQATWQINRLAP